MNTHLISYHYNRQEIRSGILHIGVGNFHRAHQAYFTNLLLENATQHDWGICGAMLLPADEPLFHALESQNNQYTLTVCGRNGNDEVFQIGSIIELLWAQQSPASVLAKIANKDIKIISLTITEGGYDLKKAAVDLENPHTPTTVFGYIAEGLRQRKALGNGPVTILSCDNLQHNGDTARNVFCEFIEKQDATLAEWVNKNVTFPNSMVDRITPATTAADVVRLNTQHGTADQAPVYCEDFIQWVIEDNFAAGRPAWEQVGVEFTKDVTAYENMKLSLLNASHTLLSYPAFLAGYRKVDIAMRDERYVRLLRNFMDMDITPYVPAPGNTNLEVYKQTLIERFANQSVSDQLSRLCADGISKFPVYIVPNLSKMINDQKELTRMAFLIASYRHYLKYKKDDRGCVYDIAEPWLNADDQKWIASDAPIDFLQLSAFGKADLAADNRFCKVYVDFVGSIKEKGIILVLDAILV